MIIASREVHQGEPGGGEGVPARVHQGREGRDRRSRRRDRSTSRQRDGIIDEALETRRLQARDRHGRSPAPTPRPTASARSTPAAPGADGVAGVRRLRHQGRASSPTRSGTASFLPAKAGTRTAMLPAARRDESTAAADAAAPFVDFQRRLARLQRRAAGARPVRGRGHHAADRATASSSPSSGPSGCGKSTFMKLATGPEACRREGTILIDGQPVTGPLKIVGMAFQAPIAAALAHHARQRAAAAGDRRAATARSFKAKRERVRRASARELLQKRRPRRLRGQVPVAALRRHAAARLDLPRADPRAEDAAARRAVRRARRLHARGAVVHPARPVGGAALQRHPGHARPARGGVPRRHRVRDEQAARAASSCGARSTCRGRATSRSPTPSAFTDIVHELREHIGAIRKALTAAHGSGMQAAPRRRALGAAGSLLGDRCSCCGRSSCRVLQASPSSSSRARARIVAAAGRVHAASSPAHAWRTFWATMVGFGSAIVVGVLLGFLIGSSRLAYAAVYPLMVGFNALPKAAFVPILVVWFGIGVGPGDPHRVPDLASSRSWSTSPPAWRRSSPSSRTCCACSAPSAGTCWSRSACRARCPTSTRSLKVAITLAFVGTMVSEMTRRQRGHRLPDDLGRLVDADAAGVRRPGRDRRDGDGDVRAVRGRREAHHRLGAPERAAWTRRASEHRRRRPSRPTPAMSRDDSTAARSRSPRAARCGPATIPSARCSSAPTARPC